jgi:hypothetical protein
MFEVFNPVDGSTQGYFLTENEALSFCERAHPAFLEYLPANDGYYITDGSRPISYVGDDYSKARSKANMLNMASDTRTYYVVPYSN